MITGYCAICKNKLDEKIDYMSALWEKEHRGKKCHSCAALPSENDRMWLFFKVRGLDWQNGYILTDAGMAKVIGEWESKNHGISRHLLSLPGELVQPHGEAQSKLERLKYTLKENGCWSRPSSDQLMANALRGWCASGGGIESLSPYYNYGEETKKVFQDYQDGKLEPKS